MASRAKQKKGHRSSRAERAAAAAVLGRAAPAGESAPPAPRHPRAGAAFALLLTAATLAVFWPALDNGFVNFDDPVYVTDNPHVQHGLAAGEIAWAWTANRAGNWHPLTWMSHMLDWQLFGAVPWGHHLTSLLLHLASSLLLFVALARWTARAAESAFVALAFALHPLHVESVAWIAERKDVLSGLFFMLVLLAYARYVRVRSTGSYVAVAAALALGLAAKPMLVTLPFVLLLLDVWPLGRSGRGKAWGLVREKIPLLVLAAAASSVTFLAQRAGQSVAPEDLYPFGVRISNAIVSYAVYLKKTLWPSDLAVYYPHPGAALPVWQIGGAALLLLLLSAVAVGLRRRCPYVLVGWLWYLGTLVPVIGLVQVGAQGLADRYTYLPLIGIFVIVAWGVSDAVRRLGARLIPGAGVAGALVLLLMAWGTRAQLRHWKDSEALFVHALAVTDDNFMAHTNLGVVMAESGRVPEAIEHYSAALRIRPQFSNLHVNLGNALRSEGRIDEAVAHYQEALRIDSGFMEAHYNLGSLAAAQGRVEESVAHLRRALESRPDHPLVHNKLASSLERLGQIDLAIVHYETAIRLKPDFGRAYAGLAGALLSRGRLAQAKAAIENARRHGFEPPAEVVQALSEKMPL